MASRIKGITVEIGGDTTGLDSALKSVNSSIRTTNTSLRDVNRLLKLDPKNVELVEQKQKLLQSAVQDTKSKLEALKEADKQAKVQLENGELGKDKYDALQREIADTEAKLKSLELQTEKTSSFMAKLGESGDKLKNLGSNIESVGKKFALLSGAVTAGGIASANLAMKFEDSIAKLNTVADTAEVPLKDLEKSIVDLSNQTGISANDIAQNVYDAISSGQKTGDAVSFVANATKLSKAGFAESGKALDVLTTIMNAYGLEASEVGRVSDILIKTQDIGKTTVGEMAESMGKVIPTANAYGVQLDQLATGYSIMTSKGIGTAETTTYLNAMINEFGKSGTKVSNIVKSETGKSFQELMKDGYSLADVLEIVKKAAEDQGLSIGDMFGSVQASKAALSLASDGASEFNAVLEETRNCTGATEKGFDKLKTNSYKIEVAMNKLKNVLTDFGKSIMTVLSPVIERLGEKVEKLKDWFNSLSDSQKENIVKVGLILAGLTPLIIIIGKVAGAIGTIMTVMSTLSGVVKTVRGAFAIFNATLLVNPIFLIIAGIVALVAGFVLLWNKSEAFRQFWITLWEGIKTGVMTAWTAISEFFAITFEAIGLFITTVWNGIKEFFVGLWEGIKLVFEMVLNGISSAISFYFELCKTIITTIFEGIKNAIIFVWDAIKNAITVALEIIKGIIEVAFTIISTIISTIFNTVKNIVVAVWNGISSFISGAVNGIRNIITSVFNGVKNTISSIFNGIKNVAVNVWNGIKNAIITPVENAKNKVCEIIEKIKGFFGGMKLNLPHIKLPHFRIEGKLSISPPSIPKLSIDWYKEGGIMSRPTIFGMNGSSLMAGGEAGKEAILPLKSFYDNLDRMLSNKTDTSLMENYLSIIAKNSDKDIYLDNGTLVGELLPSIDAGLGRIAIRKERG